MTPTDPKKLDEAEALVREMIARQTRMVSLYYCRWCRRPKSSVYLVKCPHCGHDPR